MEKKKAFVIEPNGQAKEIEFTNESFLKTFQKEVGGLIQGVSIGVGMEIFVNEEGLLMSLPINPIATSLATEHFAEFLPAGQDYILVGNAVFVGEPDEDGNSKGLDLTQIAMLSMLAKLGELIHQTARPF